MLPKDIPNSRIFAFGYDADVVRVLDVASSNTVRNHGNSLAFDLALERVMTKTNDRPVIFVAHSLGGIVAEQVGNPDLFNAYMLELVSNYVTGSPYLQRVCRNLSEEPVKQLLRNSLYGHSSRWI